MICNWYCEWNGQLALPGHHLHYEWCPLELYNIMALVGTQQVCPPPSSMLSSTPRSRNLKTSFLRCSCRSDFSWKTDLSIKSNHEIFGMHKWSAGQLLTASDCFLLPGMFTEIPASNHQPHEYWEALATEAAGLHIECSGSCNNCSFWILTAAAVACSWTHSFQWQPSYSPSFLIKGEIIVPVTGESMVSYESFLGDQPGFCFPSLSNNYHYTWLYVNHFMLKMRNISSVFFTKHCLS